MLQVKIATPGASAFANTGGNFPPYPEASGAQALLPTDDGACKACGRKKLASQNRWKTASRHRARRYLRNLGDNWPDNEDHDNNPPDAQAPGGRGYSCLETGVNHLTAWKAEARRQPVTPARSRQIRPSHWRPMMAPIASTPARHAGQARYRRLPFANWRTSRLISPTVAPMTTGGARDRLPGRRICGLSRRRLSPTHRHGAVRPLLPRHLHQRSWRQRRRIRQIRARSNIHVSPARMSA